MFKNYCSSFPNKYDIKIGSVSKLVSNLLYESNYVLHYKHLQMYLLLGMKLVSDHIILKLKEWLGDWLKKYTDFRSDKRKNAVNSLENDFLKLMSNSAYGKAMENIRKRVQTD